MNARTLSGRTPVVQPGKPGAVTRCLAAAMLVAAWLLAGCEGEPLGIKIASVNPDPVVIDVAGVADGATAALELKIGIVLIGDDRVREDAVCSDRRVVVQLRGLSLGPILAFANCSSEGDAVETWALNAVFDTLRAQPSGLYAARAEITRCHDSERDLLAGTCGTAQYDFSIELRGAAPAAPPPPAQDFVAAIDGGTVMLSWRDEPRAQSWLLERQTGDAAFAALATLPAFSAGYRDGSAAANTDYTYRLTALNATGSSSPVTASARIGETRSLTVNVNARGSDGVSSVPAGIACPGDCSQIYLLNELVRLTPMPSTMVAGVLSRFRGWSGDPDCSDGSVTMDADKVCTAEFTSVLDARLLTVSQAGSGSGRVTSSPAGIDCPGACSAFFGLGSGPVLTATPAAASVFVAWTGPADCASGIPTMNADITCTANFASIGALEPTLTVYVQGSGTVTSAPTGIDCSGAAACLARFPRDQVVVLTATPGAGHRFLGWSGAADCADGQITLGVDLTCVANFVATEAQWFTGAAALNQGSPLVAAHIDAPAMAVDAAGRPVVAWTEDQAVYLYRPFGAGVTQLSVNPRNGAPSLVMEAGDGPLVAFAEETATERRNVRLRRYPGHHAPGSTWTDVGTGPLDTTAAADARDPSVVIRNGRITVAWVEGDSGVDLRVVVRSWDGSRWSAVGSGGGPTPIAATTEIERPRLVVTGTGLTQSLALMWREDVEFLRVVELVGEDWVATATAPYAAAAQAGPFDIMWTADLGLVVAAAGAGGSIQVRHWMDGLWADVGTPRGDAGAGSFVIDLAFSHGPVDSTPLLVHALNRSGGAVQETVVERFVGAVWVRLGNALPSVDRHSRPASPRAVAVADHARPEVAVLLRGVLPGTGTADHTLAVYRFE